MRFILLIWLISLFACSQANQHETTRQLWYKGNLHTHSFWSDGDEFPEMIMDWYKSHDYQFVALTDHNILANKEFWVSMDDSLKETVFDRYMETYGPDWVHYQVDSGITRVQLKTFDQYRPIFEEPNRFLILPAEEISDRFEDKPLHLNATNLEELIEPQGGNSVAEVLQRNINALYRQRDQTGKPMIIHINHPNFHFAITVEDLIALQGERFFELYNGHHMVFNLGDSAHIDTETMWDQVNIAYLKNGKPPLYGLATDDSHNYHRKGRQWSNSGRGWIQVAADTLSEEAIIGAMELGDFYASTGVELNKVEVTDNRLTVEADPSQGPYQIEFIGCDRSSDKTRVLHRQSGNKASYQISPEHLFVRARILSDQPQDNPVESFTTQIAWTQPVMYRP